MIQHYGWVYYSAFLAYMTFTYFAVLNVITALFCQQVVEHALTVDVFENKMESLQQVEKDLLRLFNELDDLARSHDSPPGTVTNLHPIRLVVLCNLNLTPLSLVGFGGSMLRGGGDSLP